MRRVAWPAAWLLLGWTRLLWGQAPASLGGTVWDAESGRPVAEAEVRAAGLAVRSGADGRFSLGTLEPGRLTVQVRGIGYRPASREVDLLPGQRLALEIRLVPLAIELDTIAVSGARAGAGLALERAALAARGRDLAAALDGWEGIAIRRGASGEASPTVRGSAPDEVLVLVDGFPLNDPYTGRADLRRISTASVRRVVLEPGQHTARYGARAVAGVLRIELAARVRPELSLWSTTQGAQGGAVAAGGGRAAATLMRDELPDRYAYDVPAVRGGGTGTRTNAGGTIWSLTGRYDGPVELSLRGSRSVRGVPGPVTNPTPNAGASDWSLLVGARTRGAWQVSASFEMLSTRFRDPAPPVGPAYDAETGGIGAGLELARGFPAAGGRWTAAVLARHDRFHGDGVRDGAAFSRGGLRVSGSLDPGGRIHLTPVARLDWWDGLDRPVASTRLDLAAELGGVQLDLGAGNGVSAPVLADLLFRGGNGVRVNPDLKPERVVWEIEGGLRAAGAVAGARVSAGVRAYDGRVADLVLWGLSPGFGFVWIPRNFDVRRRGGEVTLEVEPLAGLTLRGTGALSAVTHDRPGGAHVLYRPRYTGEASAEWRRGRWAASARWHYIGSRYPNNSGLNPLAGFALFDLGAEVQVAAPLAARVDLYDLTDRRPSFIAGFPAPGRRAQFTLTLRLP